MILTLLIFEISFSFDIDKNLERNIERLELINEYPTFPQCHFTEIDNLNENSLMEICMLNLCGEREELPSVYLDDTNFDEYVKEGIMDRFSEVETKIRNIIENDLDRVGLLIDKIKERNSNKEFDFNFDESDDDIYEKLINVYFKHTYYQIDTNMPLADRVQIDVILPENISEEVKQGVNAYIEMKKENIKNLSWEGIEQHAYTREETEQFLKKEWNDFYNEYTRQKELNSKFMDLEKSSIERFKNYMESLNLDKEGIDSLQSNAFELLRLIRSFNNQLPGTSLELKSACNNICKKGVEKYHVDFISKLIAGLDKEAIIENRKELVEKEIAECKSHFAMQGLKNNEKEIKEIRDSIAKAFSSKFLPLVSENSKKAIKDYFINDLNWISDFQSAEESVQNFIDEVNSRYENLKTPKNDDTYFFSNTNLLSTIQEHLNTEGKFDPLKNSYVCGSMTSSLIRDSFFSKEDYSIFYDKNDSVDVKDSIYVSPFSCTHKRYGMGILSHEAGHALSQLFLRGELSIQSNLKYKELRSCATSLYKQKNSFDNYVLIRHEGDGPRTEEDTADLISYMVTERGVLHSCASFSETGDLSLDGIHYNPHSSNFMRLLQEAIHKKVDLPESCLKIIDNNKEKYRFEACF